MLIWDIDLGGGDFQEEESCRVRRDARAQVASSKLALVTTPFVAIYARHYYIEYNKLVLPVRLTYHSSLFIDKFDEGETRATDALVRGRTEVYSVYFPLDMHLMQFNFGLDLPIQFTEQSNTIIAKIILRYLLNSNRMILKYNFKYSNIISDIKKKKKRKRETTYSLQNSLNKKRKFSKS